MPDTATTLPNEPLSDVERLAQAAREALTDGMVERLTTMGANAMEVADRLNDEDVRDAVVKGLDRLAELNRVGALDTAFDMLFMVHALRNTMTDSMVDRLFSFMEHMVNNLGTEELAALAHNTRRAMEEAVDETAGQPAPGGMMATLKMLSDPQTQRALRFMLSFSCRLQSRAVAMRGNPNGA